MFDHHVPDYAIAAGSDGGLEADIIFLTSGHELHAGASYKSVSDDQEERQPSLIHTNIFDVRQP